MANQNIIEEYLVKLGFAPTDTVGLARFNAALKDISGMVDNTYTSMAKKVLGYQVATTSAFAAIGTAALTFADKTAMADQEYRLLALHMYTTLPVARELKVALDALGQPLENVMWDPELARRFHQLVTDQQTMTEQLGPDFENQMLKIRDVRFEFTRFGVELQYLTMMVVEDLAKAFGTSIDGILVKMRNFNDYIVAHMPEIAAWITTKLKPILIDVYNVLAATWRMLAQIGGQLKTIDWVAVIGDIGKAIIAMTQLEANIALLFSAANAARKGNFSEALEDLRKMQKVTGAPEGAGMPSAAKIVPEGFGPGANTPANVRALIAQAAQAYGVPPELALAVGAQESGYHQLNAGGGLLTNSKSGAMGVMQLLPQTAKALGVNPADLGQNIYGGVRLLSELLSQYKDQATALSHYGGRGGAESQAYAAEVMKREGDIHITVNAKTNASADDIANTVADAFEETMKMRRQRNLAEFQTPGWSY